MRARPWLVVSLALSVATALVSSCKGTAGSGTTGGASTTGTGGAGGTTTGTGGHKVDAGPILCLATSTNIPKNGPCDLINQDCPAGSTCSPASGTAGITTACQASSGLKTADEDCYASNECDARLVCIGQTASHPGKCVAFCCPDSANEPCNGGICNLQVDFGGGSYAYVCSYGKRCTLLEPAACPPGYDCHVETAAGQGVAVCISPSPSEVGELGTCHFINDCGSMQDCYGLGGAGDGVCLYYCALSGPNTGAAPGLGGCPTGETCQSSYKGQSVNTGVDGVGLCIPDGGIVVDAGADAASDAGADAASDGGADAASDGGADAASDGGDAGAGDSGITDAAEAG